MSFSDEIQNVENDGLVIPISSGVENHDCLTGTVHAVRVCEDSGKNKGF